MIVKKISVKNSFLYLVAYFVDKKKPETVVQNLKKKKKKTTRGIQWLHVCANVCERVSVCVCVCVCVCV